jgi:hypothetical protein
MLKIIVYDLNIAVISELTAAGIKNGYVMILA